MSIKGETETSNDSIALTGLYIDEKYCKHEPLGAKQGNKHKTYVYGYTFDEKFTFASCGIMKQSKTSWLLFWEKFPLKGAGVSHKNAAIDMEFHLVVSVILVTQIIVCD